MSTGEIDSTCYTNPLLVPVESPLMFMGMIINVYEGDQDGLGISWLYLPIDHYKIRIAQDDIPAYVYKAYGEVATQWEVKGCIITQENTPYKIIEGTSLIDI